MYRVIIFGTGQTAQIVESGLNKNVTIVCYLDNDNSKWDRIYNNKYIRNPKEIQSINYDFIIIASQYNESIYSQLMRMNVKAERILQFYKYVDSYYNYIEFELLDLKENNSDVQAIGTGISYMSQAIDKNSLCKRYFSLANPSQDLYFDYELMKYIIENIMYSENDFKYALIGLSYYSLHYDLSMSSMKGKVILYYEILKKYNNSKNVEQINNCNKINKIIGSKIFKFSLNNKIMFKWNNNDNMKLEISEGNGKKQVELDSNKNYPKTVEENINILDKYFKLLCDNNIKPIVIVSPVSKYYNKYFPKRFKEELYEVIDMFKKKYEFQFIDYFYSDVFSDEDFHDVSHLNKKGAKKFTKLLNNNIRW